jgi:hypothetical protein
MTNSDFLPVLRDDMRARDWYYYVFLLVTGDAYVDHPSFGAAVIARALEADGYRVAVLTQPDWKSADDFLAMGRPRYGALVGAGNLDSMVAHYTAAKKPRRDDAYSPAARPAGGPTARRSSTPTACARLSRDCPLSSAGWRRHCGVLPITITGR